MSIHSLSMPQTCSLGAVSFNMDNLLWFHYFRAVISHNNSDVAIRVKFWQLQRDPVQTRPFHY